MSGWGESKNGGRSQALRPPLWGMYGKVSEFHFLFRGFRFVAYAVERCYDVCVAVCALVVWQLVECVCGYVYYVGCIFGVLRFADLKTVYYVALCFVHYAFCFRFGPEKNVTVFGPN